MKVFIIASLCSIAAVSAFTIPTLPKPEVVIRNVAGSVIATSTILSNVIMLPQVSDASDANINSAFDSTTQLLAARSGGRAGGRAAPSRSVSRPSSSSPTVIQRRTTVIQQPIYTSPSVMMSPGYYSPQPSGLGLAIGLNAVSGIADGFREARQENEIRSTRDQLNESRIREAEMAARLQQLEKQQQQQLMMTK
jgi:hypothetical protein